MDGKADEFEMRCKLCESPIKPVSKADRFCCEGCRDLFEKIGSAYVIDSAAEGLDLRSLAPSEGKR